jgi:hypothetical protein
MASSGYLRPPMREDVLTESGMGEGGWHKQKGSSRPRNFVQGWSLLIIASYEATRHTNQNKTKPNLSQGRSVMGFASWVLDLGCEIFLSTVWHTPTEYSAAHATGGYVGVCKFLSQNSYRRRRLYAQIIPRKHRPPSCQIYWKGSTASLSRDKYHMSGMGLADDECGPRCQGQEQEQEHGQKTPARLGRTAHTLTPSAR